MNPFIGILTTCVIGVTALTACALMDSQRSVIGYHQDYRTIYADGKIDYGKIGDSYTAGLVMYVAGNQFMVMEELVRDFQKANPYIKTVYVETMPPGHILEGQILKQGKVGGQKTNRNPDLFASVNIGHLSTLKQQGRMEKHMIYIHNNLELMVAKGNPKKIKGAEDLTRDDLIQSHPNPLTEGIFEFYATDMLKHLQIYEKITGGVRCQRCWAIPGKIWFTERHYRDTPYRIENGEADVGIVWSSEVVGAQMAGRNIEGVRIAKPDKKLSKASYAIGILTNAKNQANAESFLEYLRTTRAQGIYAKYGFRKATAEDLEYKPL